MSRTDSEIESLITFYSSMLVSGACVTGLRVARSSQSVKTVMFYARYFLLFSFFVGSRLFDVSQRTFSKFFYVT